MSQIIVEESTLKSLVKEAILELLEERQSLFYDVVAEALEDHALAQAIHEGESTPYTTEEEVLRILEA